MQQVLRPYATAGIALVGASMIAVTPVVVPLPEIQTHSVKLVDAWSDLLTDTTANLANISANTDLTAITGVFQALLSNPLGVFQALTDLSPTVDASIGTLPATVNIDLPPGLELLLAQIGAEGAALNAVNDVVAQLATNPSGAFTTLLEAPAVIANAFLNGTDNISLLGGLINIAGFNGILAPLQDVSVNLNLANLLDTLGVGDISLSSLGINLTDLLNQIGLGNLDLGGLFTALGIGDDGLGTLLGNPTLSGLLGDLGLGGLGLGSFSLTDFLSDLGLNTNVDLNSLSLDSVLNLFGIDPTVNIGLAGLLDNLGFGSFLDTGLGTGLSNLGLLAPLFNSLNGVLSGVLGPVAGLLNPILGTIGLNTSNLLSLSSLTSELNDISIGQLLGGQTLNDSLANILGALGVSDITPTDLSVADLLEGLGFPATTGDLSLTGLLDNLGAGGLQITDLLNTIDLNTLLGDLGLSDYALDLSNLGDLTNLTIGGLLGDLGLGDIATIDIDGFGGLITQLVDTIPQQILAALSG